MPGLIGKVVGNYRVLEKVGEGGMGTVYRALDLMLEREAALKVIRPELTLDLEALERFGAEARLLARVNHPAIAAIYSFFLHGENLFLALEYVRGESLGRLLRREGALSWERAVALLGYALDGIAEAHRAGIVHRDLKPDNLMITDAGTVKVMDFGIAREVDTSRGLTRTGFMIGTLRYMSPEQIREHPVDRRTDIYALGVVLFEMLTGRLPFDGGSDFGILRSHVEEPPPAPRSLVPELPEWLDHAILRALAKDPADRFQSIEELQQFLATHGG
ncbi:MAG: serine/threonine protein kinase, partial [Acidobacteriota bacterium]|nr:serine/threonine protein kinase [Acidobacteriota bacterium]